LLPDLRILARHGARHILHQRQEIMWPDGSSIWLHDVRSHGLPKLFERATPVAESWLLVDLRTLAPALDHELRRTHERDLRGHLFYALRHAFADAAAFREALVLHAETIAPVPADDANCEAVPS